MITEITNDNYTTQEKLQILADAAKYDVACTSSGSSRRGKKGELGNAEACGICHSFAADGRCISLLKILMTNHCAYDCKYCINRASNDVRRATFTPQEICELTVEFYKRNYIEGLFLSSGVLKNPTYTMEKMCETLLLLRTRYHFNGYIHVKTIPGASDELLAAAGYLADRISVNLELPTETALRSLAPNKTMQNILNPMGKVQNTIASHRIAAGKSAYMDRNRGNQFLRNGIFSDDSKKTFREKLNMQNTDAKPGNNPPLKKEDPNLISRDKNKFTKHILTWENACQLAPLDMSDLKRVFYSAYIPLNDDSILPQIGTPPPLLREHRLYQADWLLRFYGFQADELLSESQPNFNELLDPKCDWALRHLEHFPVEVEKASYATLLRVPGIGPKSASRITYARRYGRLNFDNLKRMGVVLKRAHYFITCGGRQMYRTPIEEAYITRQLVQVDAKDSWKVQHSNESYSQMTLADFGIG